MQKKLTLRYDDEFIHQVARLPAGILDAMYAFLERLAENPDDPDLGVVATSHGLCGCQFTSGYLIYWKVEREQRGRLTTLMSSKPTLIEVRRIKPPDFRST